METGNLRLELVATHVAVSVFHSVFSTEFLVILPLRKCFLGSLRSGYGELSVLFNPKHVLHRFCFNEKKFDIDELSWWRYNVGRCSAVVLKKKKMCKSFNLFFIFFSTVLSTTFFFCHLSTPFGSVVNVTTDYLRTKQTNYIKNRMVQFLFIGAWKIHFNEIGYLNEINCVERIFHTTISVILLLFQKYFK